MKMYLKKDNYPIVCTLENNLVMIIVKIKMNYLKIIKKVKLIIVIMFLQQFHKVLIIQSMILII